jgi:hypothetical protein
MREDMDAAHLRGQDFISTLFKQPFLMLLSRFSIFKEGKASLPPKMVLSSRTL